MAGGTHWAGAQAPSLADIERLAAAAWQRLPREFRDMCGDVVIRVEDFATDDVLQSMKIESPFDLMGLFHGVSLNNKSVMDPGASPTWCSSTAAPCWTIGPNITKRSATWSRTCWCTRSATISGFPMRIWSSLKLRPEARVLIGRAAVARARCGCGSHTYPSPLLVPELAVANRPETGKARTNLGNLGHGSSLIERTSPARGQG